MENQIADLPKPPRIAAKEAKKAEDNGTQFYGGEINLKTSDLSTPDDTAKDVVVDDIVDESGKGFSEPTYVPIYPLVCQFLQLRLLEKELSRHYRLSAKRMTMMKMRNIGLQKSTSKKCSGMFHLFLKAANKVAEKFKKQQ